MERDDAMSPCPFDRETIERLLRGEFTPEARRRLRAHLDEDCPACERLFADLPEAFDFLLGPEAAEVKQTPGLSAGEKDELFAAAKRPIRRGGLARTAWPRRLLLAAGVVLAVGLFLAVPRRERPTPSPLVKDGNTAAFDGRVILQFAVALPDPQAEGGRRLVRGENDARYPASARLAFRGELPSPAFAYLFRAGPDGRAELIHPQAGANAAMPKGKNDFMRGKEIFLFPLEKIDGVQTFCLAVFPSPPPDLAAVAKGIGREVVEARETVPPRRDGLDCFRIRVEKP
jgi:hypothetical protein